MNGHIRYAGIGMARIAHAERDIGTCINRGVRRRGNETVQIKAWLSRKVHDLLTRSGTAQRNGLDGIFGRAAEQTPKLPWVAVKQLPHAAAAGKKADEHARVGMTGDVVEEHGGAFLCRALDCAASADIAVNAR